MPPAVRKVYEMDSNAAMNSQIYSTANYLGLTKSALDLINSSSPVTKLAHSIIRWMGRECISESDFNYCLERSTALAFPNEHGLQIRKSILESESKIAKVGGLHLIAAGAIGRWMTFSQDHVYMVTTVAAVTKFQSILFASTVLCELVLADMAQSLDEGETYRSHAVNRARLMGVLSKVTDSISLNVVNSGHGLGDLPAELQPFCVHLVGASLYARLILQISRSTTDLLLLCDRFQGDIILWVLTHYEGNIEVSVAGENKFRRNGSSSKRRFTMIVKAVCQEGCHKASHYVELSEHFGGTWTRLLQGRDDPTMRVSPAQRLPLYTLAPEDNSAKRDILNREELYKIRVLAQRFVLWLMDVPLTVKDDFRAVGFEAAFDCVPADIQLRIGDILLRVPELLHDLLGKGLGSLTPVSFIRPKAGKSQDSDMLYDPDLQPLSTLCSSFPALSDLLKEISNRCKCRICRNKGIIDDCKGGCLCEAAVSRLFMLLGNAIADGFGVLDASGISELDDYTAGVHQLLSNLVEGYVWWDVWFNVAASTALGYPPGYPPKKSFGDSCHVEGSNALVAVQYGSNVIAARWLDLNRKCRVYKCFAIEMAEGQVHGIQENCAFLLTDTTMDLECDLRKATTWVVGDDLDVWHRKISEKDDSLVTLQQALIGSKHLYSTRLVTFISTGSSQRIIDPADTLLSVIRSSFIKPQKVECQHLVAKNAKDTTTYRCPEDEWYLWSFDDLLNNWEIKNQGVFLTKTLDTELKVNVALSLSAKGCVVREASACLKCTFKIPNAIQNASNQRIISNKIDKLALVAV